MEFYNNKTESVIHLDTFKRIDGNITEVVTARWGERCRPCTLSDDILALGLGEVRVLLS